MLVKKFLNIETTSDGVKIWYINDDGLQYGFREEIYIKETPQYG